MITATPYSPSALLSFKPPITPPTPGFSYHHKKNLNQKRIRNGTCRAEFSHDAPFAAAIGACMLSSLVLPITSGRGDDSDSTIDSTDSRFAVMGIISFIPCFNWLSWVFAWLDTGKRRYAVYTLVYLAPYLRSNLSLSPEESWLPIASIVFCIIHIQLEASIRNGDLQGFQLFSEAVKLFPSITRKKHTHLKGHQGVSNEERTKEPMNLPSAEQQSKDEIPWWGVPKNPLEDPEHLNGGWDDEERRKH